MATVLGIHHVTAIAGDPQTNVDFYAGMLGLRLVKLTVNYDDPGTYHLYYGDGEGHPGTLITFFPWPGAARGRNGNGQVTSVGFAVPEGSLEFWTQRLAEHQVRFEGPFANFEEQAVSFIDPDGLQLELVAARRLNPSRVWRNAPVPMQYAIHGLHHVTLSEEGYDRTAALLTDTLGFRLTGQHDNRFRYAIQAGEPGALVDLLCKPDGSPGRVAVGTVHHVAWRTEDDEQQHRWRTEISRLGFNVTPIIDRTYFHSIYFREPGGVLFEIATDPPGFAVDESPGELGAHLVLPKSLEPARSALQRMLPPLHLPAIEVSEK